MQHKKSPKNRKLLFLLLSVVFIACSLVLLEATNTINLVRNSQPLDQETTRPVNSVDYGPPTEQEAAAGDEQKKTIVEEETKNTAKKTTDLVIVDASQYGSEVEIRAFVPNYIGNGNCKFTFSKDGEQNIQKTMPATADASTSTCMTLAVPISEYPVSGKWSLLVTFTSSDTTASAEQEVSINK